MTSFFKSLLVYANFGDYKKCSIYKMLVNDYIIYPFFASVLEKEQIGFIISFKLFNSSFVLTIRG